VGSTSVLLVQPPQQCRHFGLFDTDSEEDSDYDTLDDFGIDDFGRRVRRISYHGPVNHFGHPVAYIREELEDCEHVLHYANLRERYPAEDRGVRSITDMFCIHDKSGLKARTKLQLILRRRFALRLGQTGTNRLPSRVITEAFLGPHAPLDLIVTRKHAWIILWEIWCWNQSDVLDWYKKRMNETWRWKRRKSMQQWYPNHNVVAMDNNCEGNDGENMLENQLIVVKDDNNNNDDDKNDSTTA
jgi:hypothetical protein